MKLFRIAITTSFSFAKSVAFGLLTGLALLIGTSASAQVQELVASNKSSSKASASLASLAKAESAEDFFNQRELSINGLRNPSIGLEYRRGFLSVHAGYYPTIFSSNGESQGFTTSFIRTGVTAWYLPFSITGQNRAVPSALYSFASWLWGQSHDYVGVHAAKFETGVRVGIWKGLQARLGLSVVIAPGRPTHLNPTPGISYSIPL